jgi:hypothetical protein
LAQAKENLARLTDEVELAVDTAYNKLERMRQMLKVSEEVVFHGAPDILRRTNQFRDFVRVLKLRTVHLDNCATVSKQNLGSGFDNARLPASLPDLKQRGCDGPGRWLQPCAKHLLQVDQGNFFSQCTLKVARC